MLTVTDSGRGVPDHQRERIFDRMVRLRGEEVGAGSGLGLNIARGYARAHGGEVICAPAEPGRGARFVLTLPLIDQFAQRRPSPLIE
ncbi:sensor histidine kinase [Enemella evansiae]|uniref:sensor histidine kinase n=1 Tax=Enemella evansiae TaxID=2016499 RepID=UPI0015C61CEC|nr:sensor histidine kinase [Enemella evansiae]